MAQSLVDDFPIDPTTTSGTELADRLNRFHDAVQTSNAGGTQPPEMFAGQLWLDTSDPQWPNGRMKLRNATNTAWLDAAAVSNALQPAKNLSDVANAATACANLGAVKKAGDTMTGPLILSADPTDPMGAATKQYADSKGAGFVAKAGDTMTGTLNMQGATINMWGASVSSPRLYFRSGGVSAPGPHMRYNTAFEIVNAADTAINLTLYDNGDLALRGKIDARWRVNILNGNGTSGELGLQNTGGGSFFTRGRGGGGIEWINNAYNAVVASMEDNGTFHIGNVTLATDGNLYMPLRGQWLNDAINSKIGGAVCNHNTGVAEWGPMAGGDWAATLDIPGPWVVTGIRCSYGNGDLTTGGTFLRGVQLRNY